MLKVELATNYLKKEKLSAKLYNDAIVIPLKYNKQCNYLAGGVFDSNHQFIHESNTLRRSPPNFKVDFSNWYEGQLPEEYEIKKHYSGGVYIGALPKHYGHFITEGLSRLWYVLENKDKIEQVFYISENGRDPFLEIFDLLNLAGVSFIKINKISKLFTVR